MDFLSFFVVRTAFPFGYLIFLGLPMLGAVVWGLVLLRRDIRAHPNPGRMRMSWGLVVLTGVALFIGANVAYARALDLNPSLAADDLVGVWRDGGATLTLHPDGTYGCTGGGGCASFGREGKWTHDGSFQLDFAAADLVV